MIGRCFELVQYAIDHKMGKNTKRQPCTWGSDVPSRSNEIGGEESCVTLNASEELELLPIVTLKWCLKRGSVWNKNVVIK